MTVWGELVPLILGCALEPVELVITMMLLGTPSRVRAAGAWIGGHLSVRLLQGVIFGAILHWGARSANANHPHRWIVSTVLLVVALLFLITAVREFFSGDDPSAPPPKWMTLLTSATPVKAFLIGAGIMTISIKSWVLTLAAISAIGHAGLTRVDNILCYLSFVVLATGGNLLLVGVAAFFPGRSDALLNRTLRWLRDNDRPILIVVGLVFGVWFGVKALHGFGVL